MRKYMVLAVAAVLALPLAARADLTLNFGGISSTDTGDVTAGVSTRSATTATNEIISDIEVVLNGAVHDWVGDLQITLSNGTSEIIIMGLQEGLTFNGTVDQRGNPGAGVTFGSSAHLSGDPDLLPTPLDYTFRTGGADFDAAATAATGGLLIDNATIYAPTAENALDTEIGTVLSFADVFAGQSTAGTWTISVVDTFPGGDNGSFTGFTVNFSSAPIPEPGSAALLGLGLCGLVAFRRRR